MTDMQPTLNELKKQLDESKRKLRNAQASRNPDKFVLDRLESDCARWAERIRLVKELWEEERDLEYTLSYKMMSRYPAEQVNKLTYRRDLSHIRRRLKEMAEKYKPAEQKPKRYY